jgi:hypothetical protein
MAIDSRGGLIANSHQTNKPVSGKELPIYPPARPELMLLTSGCYLMQYRARLIKLETGKDT